MRTSIFILFVLLASNSYSQLQLFRKKIQGIPFKYTKPYENMSLAPSKGLNTAQPWIVFSDRDSNYTYSNPEASTKLKTMLCLEDFYVVEEKGDYVHIYKDSNPKRRVGKDAIDYGWINKKNLILWRSALHNKEDVQKKVMILNTEDSVKRYRGESEERLVVFYNDPELIYENQNEAEVFCLYYIYKLYPNATNPTSALIGKGSRINAHAIHEDIIGWTSYSKLTPWDFRVVVNPNPDGESIAEREERGSASIIFSNDQAANNYLHNQEIDTNDVIWIESQENKNNDEYIFRFPLLELTETIGGENEDIVTVGVIKKVEEEMIPIVSPEDERIPGVLEFVSGQRKHLNLILVIDGTRGMAPYYSKISEALHEFDQVIKKQPNNIAVKIGCVYYRDLSHGKRITDVIALTDDIKKVAKSIKSTREVSSRDRDESEAVFYGLKHAIQTFDLPQGQNNVLILVGNTGNHKRIDESQVNIEEVIHLLYENGYSFFACQVKHLGTEPYTEFYYQTEEILSGLSTHCYDESKSIAIRMNDKIPQPGYIMPEKIHKKIYFKTKPFIQGGIYSLIPGSTVPTKTFKKLFANRLLSIYDSADNLIMKLTALQKIISSSPLDSTGNISIRQFLIPLTLLSKHMEVLQSEVYHNYLIGHIPISLDSCIHPFWEYYLFYTNDELYNLKRFFQTLIDARTRTGIKDSWMKLAKSKKPNLTQTEINDKTVRELELLLFGCDGVSSYGNLKLKDIADESKISDQDLNSWITQIEINLRALTGIFNLVPTYSEYSFISSDMRYFWIPQRLLP